MKRVFLYGTLRDDALRRIVLGAEVAGEPSELAGFEVCAVRDGQWPALVAAEGAAAAGLLTEPLGPDELSRLDFYEASFEYLPRDVSVAGQQARLWQTPAEPPMAGAWTLEVWQERWAETSRAAAREVMEYHGRFPAKWVAKRWPMIRSRAASKVRAWTDAPPTELRRGMAAADVRVAAHRRPYSDFFTLIEQDLQHRRFDGGWSETVTRSALIGGDAVTVLPYDPVRDEVLLVEQFRFGPWSRGDARPWTLEPVAGRVDPGETPDQTARREAREEAQLEVGRLERVGAYYASTGSFSEYVYSFVGLCDLGGRGGDVSSAADEEEDILSHVIPFERLMALVASGEAEDAPLLVTAWWLAAHRERLRGSD